jgi:alpha-galactosidase
MPPVPIEPPIRRTQAEDPVYATSPLHGGSALGALEGGEGQVLLLGALGVGARVEAGEGTLRGFYEQGGGTWFAGFGGERVVFSRYAEMLAARLGRRGTGTPPRVWCSWYSFYQQIAEETLTEVLEGLSGLPFDVFQVDDGWQADVGDWEANGRFPSGMEALARRIEAAGFTPGLWLAPLLVRPTSRLYREHPDWLLRDPEGGLLQAGFNWGDFTYALDATHPDVAGWLADLIRRVRGWGYRYLKLDFIYAGALPGARRVPLPREEAYRRALAMVRDAAPDAYLLACGAPIVASVGIADGLRISPDCAPFWQNEARARDRHDVSGPATKNALWTSLHRLWLRPLVHTDPDVVYFRSQGIQLTPEQRGWLQDLALITGFRGTSDPPGWLDASERAALAAFLEARPAVGQLDRYRFTVGDRVVDFAPVAG